MSSYLFHHFQDVRSGRPVNDISVKVDALAEEGCYTLLRDEGHEHWPVEMRYTPGAEDLPVAVMLPGYRGDAVHGPGNVAGRKILKDAGFAVVAMNYSGFDHYGHKETPSTYDPATMDTHIRDVHAVMNLIGDRPVMLQPTSASITVAVQCLRPNVTDILAMTPFPNMVQERVTCLLSKTSSALLDRSEDGERVRLTHGERVRVFVQMWQDQGSALY
jgi:hypothetical protein